MIKNSIIISILLCFAWFSQAQDILPPLLSVQGKGEVRKEPDKASISIGVLLRNFTLESTREGADKKSADIIAYLQDQGINSTDIKTSYVTLQPYYDYSQVNDGDASPDYYIASKSLTFILRNLTKFDDIMEGLYANGVNSFNGIEFQIDDEEEQMILAKRRAIRNAKEIANVFAEELDIEVGRVYSVSDQSTERGSPVPYYSNSDNVKVYDGTTGPSIAGGVVVIEAYVDVKFYVIDNN